MSDNVGPVFEPVFLFNKDFDYKHVPYEKMKELKERPKSFVREILVGIFHVPDNGYLDTEDEEINRYDITGRADGHVNLKPVGDEIELDLEGARNLVSILNQKVIPWLVAREDVAEIRRQKAWDQLQEEKKNPKQDDIESFG